MKVIHAPLNYAGQTYMLSQALRAQGIDSISYRLTTKRGSSVDVYAYKDDRVIEFAWDNQLGYLFRGTQQIIAEKPDIVHFWHRPLIYTRHGDAFNGMDLPFLRLGGARIALRFTGYELRRKSLEMELNPYSPFHSGFDFGFREDEQNRFYDFIGPYVDTFLVQDPEMQTYCPEARIVPRVLDLAQFPVVEREPNARPVVVHASTDQLLKGTKFVLKAVEELKDEGLDFDFRLVEDIPNADALELYRGADIIIDQLMIGWYGVLAMETMAMGKAVIAYIRDDLTGYFKHGMPLLNANPDTIRNVLREAIKDAELRSEMGRRARAFVEATHDSRLVARDLIKIYEEILNKPASPLMPDFGYQWGLGQKLRFDQEIATTVRQTLQSFTVNELKQRLEAPLPVGEREPALAPSLASLVHRIPAETPEELERKLELLAGAGTIADVERKLTIPPFDANLLSLVRQIPAATPDELNRKLELLSKAGALEEVESKLGSLTSFEENLLKLVRWIPAKTNQELERKIAALIPKKARAAAVAQEKQRAWSHDSYLVGLARRIPASTPDELDAKIAMLIPKEARARALAREGTAPTALGRPVRRTLFGSMRTWNKRNSRIEAAAIGGLSGGVRMGAGIALSNMVVPPGAAMSSFDENLLKLLRRIPAKTSQKRERKIASLIPKKVRAAAVTQEKERAWSYDSYLAGLAHQIPAATPAELEAKIASLRTFFGFRRMHNKSQEERRIESLLRRIPAETAEELEQKIASLIPAKARTAAIARAKRRSRDVDSYLVNLTRYVVAKNPQELDRKISSLIPEVPAPPPDGRGSVCIVTRKPIRNVTRAPRMAKALVDAGYRVAVVSPAPPVDELRDMCPEVEYIVAQYRAFTHDVISRLETRQRRRQNLRQEKEREYQAVLAKGGARALMRRFRRAISEMPPLPAAKRFLWQVFVVAPSAFLLRSETQNFAELRRNLNDWDVFGIANKFVYILTQWASTHAFAARADELTAGRHFDVVQAYDNYGLVAGARLAKRTGAKLIYDAVEIATDRLYADFNILENIRERLERREESRIFLNADRLLGTGDALSSWYVKTYRIPKPLVMRNCRLYWPYRADGRLRADIGAKSDTRILLWCGSAYPAQGIEVIIAALQHLPPNIHLAVVTDIAHMWRKYIGEELPAIATACGVADRFHILSERGPNDLVPYISDGDLGFVVSVPVNHPNQYYNLPNKFFECIMARLPIGTLAFPEVVGVVQKYDIGCVLDEHDSARNAAIIQLMLEPEMYSVLKANVMKAAEVLCWENESGPYVELVDSLMPAHLSEKARASRSNLPHHGHSPALKLPAGSSVPALIPAHAAQ